MNTEEIINLISNSKKKNPLKVYLKGNLKEIDFSNVEFYGNDKFGILFCEEEDFKRIYENNKDSISNYRIERDRKNSAIPLADLSKYNARIEPGAIIRDLVEIGDGCVIMMGAVINIGASIKENTMIDMNVVIGGRAQIGKNCHIGAGTVVAGVIEPPSAQPVVIEDNVLIGANAVVLEGVKVGQGSIVGAGSVVISDVEPYSVVAGVPAKFIKKIDDKTKAKTQLVEGLRRLK
ncbi:2,3,4,5-tetrahydropyridine-2,6-dicarboxylate N-acetyltransferase [Petrotoga sibirica]|uniref:2,3,4,5-tetrahydropyridine-2,6-dicarboxylate N-acetyltransferase n=2 Tax=Petrotoga sibirica TaxID=156202 RepID=A0A4R8F1P8_9BACT|nr:2,3,4,5-tetrahydropyridine-2,6-dicarboxylate N-acetyltransferase [Petrotoga sibirica]KUK83985.1 MAG: 2,3,4,5-tetrahydropyridine-2,6-dicarboxylate N-acetyltransferase [Petrotoga mobilis]POZ88434.1 2,3,4,5-tetrahydropyridine-2,6-carboxylate N-succinyltransferase [Petrotoga sibirica DSM 13575]TDX16427.1 2,3,4,5-tetrahydropyridine-2,6-dicarboxylate N-acetyltransferase [Petrotoga sibirica]